MGRLHAAGLKERACAENAVVVRLIDVAVHAGGLGGGEMNRSRNRASEFRSEIVAGNFKLVDDCGRRPHPHVELFYGVVVDGIELDVLVTPALARGGVKLTLQVQFRAGGGNILFDGGFRLRYFGVLRQPQQYQVYDRPEPHSHQCNNRTSGFCDRSYRWLWFLARKRIGIGGRMGRLRLRIRVRSWKLGVYRLKVERLGRDRLDVNRRCFHEFHKGNVAVAAVAAAAALFTEMVRAGVFRAQDADPRGFLFTDTADEWHVCYFLTGGRAGTP